MSAEKQCTEREMVLAKREAFAAGANWLYMEYSIGMLSGNYHGEAKTLTKRLYPLPKITRPRVMMDKEGNDWRVNGLVIECRRPGGHSWSVPLLHDLNVERAHILADLLGNPTETVEDDAE